jgi:hypothetical protein
MSMAKHEIEVKITFTGSQVSLFLVSDSEVANLIDNSQREHQERFHEIIQDSGHHIYSGIDPIDGNTSIQIFVDGNPIDVEGYILADDDEEAEKLRLTVKNKMIVNSENSRWLEGNIPDDMHALVVREYFKSATANVYFEADRVVSASDFELIILSTDSPSDFAEVTYHADILPTESDLVGIVFDGYEAEPDIYIDNFKDQELFLFVRDASGKLNLTEI